MSSVSSNDAASEPIPPRVVAHRGASKAARENTLDAFRIARELGAVMVELDVRRCRTGELVIHHDPVVDGVLIKTLGRSELPEWMPGLADALDACVGMEVNIEIKNDENEGDFDVDRTIAVDVVELLHARDDADRMLISSFDRVTIDVVHRIDPTLRTGFLFVVPGLPLAAFMAGLRADGHCAVHPHRRAATKRLCQAAHRYKLDVNVWTVDKPEEMRSLARNGVDAIITNLPDVAVRTFANWPD